MDTSVPLSPFPLLCKGPHHPLQNLHLPKPTLFPIRPAPLPPTARTIVLSVSVELTSPRTARKWVVQS